MVNRWNITWLVAITFTNVFYIVLGCKMWKCASWQVKAMWLTYFISILIATVWLILDLSMIADPNLAYWVEIVFHMWIGTTEVAHWLLAWFYFVNLREAIIVL